MSVHVDFSCLVRCIPGSQFVRLASQFLVLIWSKYLTQAIYTGWNELGEAKQNEVVINNDQM